MFLEIIGLVIAFSTAMLLLSLIVSSLSQATQAVLRLRARNLKFGLSTALTPKSIELTDNSDAKIKAAEILNTREIANFRQVKNPNGLIAKLLGPRTTWLDSDALGKALKEAASSDGQSKTKTQEEVDQVVKNFENLDIPLSNRFLNIMRGVSLFWALVVAVVFQVSTPTIIEQLSSDPALRAQYVAASQKALDLGAEQIAQSRDYSDVYADAVTTFAERHPELRPELGRLDISSDEPEGLTEDFSDAIENHPDRANLITEFEELLVAGLERQRDEALKKARNASEQLSTLNISPLRYGWGFYLDREDRWSNILGVIMTAILLTLGAPFWFETLKTAVAWRDIFSPKKEPDEPDTNKKQNNSGKSEKTKKSAQSKKKGAS